MTDLVWSTHRELEPRHPCPGQVLVVDQGADVWTLECDTCGDEWGLPATKADPTAHRALMVERRRQESGIPDALRGLPLPDGAGGPETAARRWATGELRALLLTGPVGVGKTRAAASAAWERAEREPVRWVSVPVLFAQLGRGFGDEQRDDALTVLTGTGALVLDDLDKSRPTEYVAEQLFAAIDSRVAAGAALLVTTNLALSELAARFPEPYGEAIVSRLAGYCEALAMEGPDRRLERFAA
jgi:hypothetical protein